MSLPRFPILGLVALALLATPGIAAAKPLAKTTPQRLFTLTSPRLKDDAMLPAKYAGSNCRGGGSGANVSPPLAWSNPPPSTKSFALIMIDPDGGRGMGSAHWVAYNIPATRRALREGEATTRRKTHVQADRSHHWLALAAMAARHPPTPPSRTGRGRSSSSSIRRR